MTPKLPKTGRKSVADMANEREFQFLRELLAQQRKAFRKAHDRMVKVEKRLDDWTAKYLKENGLA